MTALRVVKHLDVIEHVPPGFLAVGIDAPTNPLSFQELDEALRYGVVVAVVRRLMLGIRLWVFRKDCQS